MFKQACKDLTHWMYPVIFSSHNSDGTTESHLGAGILVNDDGWLLNAGHLVKKFAELKSSEQEYQQRFKDLQPKVAAIKVKKNLTAKQRQRKISSLYAKVPVSSTSVGFMFMVPTVGVSRGIVDEVVDLGLFKLEGYQVPPSYQPPVFRTGSAATGEMLCRVGYPFNRIKATWDNGSKTFNLENPYPMPMFANEALVSQRVDILVENDPNPPKYQRRMFQTSTPGIKGQSGGPLVDPDGMVCGVQVMTQHYPLEFSPTYKGRKEHQFFNSGVAVSVKTIQGFLTEHGVQYKSS